MLNLCGITAFVCGWWKQMLVRVCPGRLQTASQELWLHIYAGTFVNCGHLKGHSSASCRALSQNRRIQMGWWHTCDPNTWEMVAGESRVWSFIIASSYTYIMTFCSPSSVPSFLFPSASCHLLLSSHTSTQLWVPGKHTREGTKLTRAFQGHPAPRSTLELQPVFSPSECPCPHHPV